MSDKAMIFIHGFGTEYVPDHTNEERLDPRTGKIVGTRTPTGKLKPRDWVEYSPLGSVQRLVVREWIELLDKPAPLTGKGGENPAVQMANARWDAIRPRYEAWKAGQELPLDGTPLAAWSGVSRSQAEVLKSHGVRTVEELAQLTDTHKDRMGIMGLGSLIEGAKRFLSAMDRSSVTRALEERDQKISELQAEMAELMEMVKEAQPKTEPKRRGRPPKAERVAA